MHPTLDLISKELEQLVAQVKASIASPDPFNIAHGNWSFPGVTRDDLIGAATSIAQLIEQRGGDTLKTNEAPLADYVRRLTFLRTNTVPNIWGNPAAGVPAYLTTLSSLRNVLEASFDSDQAQTIEAQKVEAVKSLKRTLKTLRAIEAQTSAIGSRSDNLNDKVRIIEHAHEAAEQLPTDLESLKELRSTLERLLSESTTDRKTVGDKLGEITKIREQLDNSEKEAAAVLERCDAAYRATTSEGLASAFSDRSKKLNYSMWIWVGGLIIALSLGGVIGSNQLHHLADAIKAPAAQINAGVWIDLLLTLLSIGAPVWFAWVSTKQIGQRFRLAEDYGYKASISKAYEGYRREAALLDPAFQARLFSSALTRLDEIPLRLVETDTHGSPWHELASSDVVRQAIGTVPGFVEKITDLAKQALPGSSQGKTTAAVEQISLKSADTSPSKVSELN